MMLAKAVAFVGGGDHDASFACGFGGMHWLPAMHRRTLLLDHFLALSLMMVVVHFSTPAGSGANSLLMDRFLGPDRIERIAQKGALRPSRQ
jgi:hypothetical protein